MFDFLFATGLKTFFGRLGFFLSVPCFLAFFFKCLLSKGDCDRERDSRRSSVVPRGATSTTVDSIHGLEPRNTEYFSRSLGLAVSPLDCDVRTSVSAPLLFQILQRPPPRLLPICSHKAEQ